jgi:hypothetical protein
LQTEILNIYTPQRSPDVDRSRKELVSSPVKEPNYLSNYPSSSESQLSSIHKLPKSQKPPTKKASNNRATSWDQLQDHDLYILRVLSKYIESHAYKEELLYRYNMPVPLETKEIVE